MIVGVSLAFYILGLLVFLGWGKLNDGWYDCFYFWDKCKDLLFLTSIYVLIENRHKWIVKVIMVYASIRVLWETMIFITGWDVNNKPVIGWLFIILATLCSFLTLKELFKWHRSNGR